MTQVLITRSKLDSLASAISAKSGEPLPLTIAEMEDAVDGIETGGNDFVVTLAYNDVSELWEPDKTLAEIDAAYVGGKAIVTQAFDEWGNSAPTTSGYDKFGSNMGTLYYSVLVPYLDGLAMGYECHWYTLDTSGLHEDSLSYYRDTSIATAVAADVASGKSFFTASGYETGTASGGGMDVPTFTLIVDPNSGSIQSVACDKTQAECRSLVLDDDMRLASVEVSVGGVVQSHMPARAMYANYDADVYYVVYDLAAYPVLDLVYDNGQVTAVEPSTYVGEVTYDENGTYYPSVYANPVVVNVPSSAPTLQTKSASPSESQQTVTPDSGYDGLSSVSVAAVSSTYVGSGITRRSSTDLTASGATVTVPSGYYQSQASKAVSSGTAGTPTATKGSVSNHAVSVTPSVTNAAGYIAGGTETGTAVTVSASELVSGTLNITSSGTKDVTNYASASVASGSATAPATISGTAATVSTGTNTLTLSKTVSVTPSVTAGYVASGTAGNSSVSLTANVTTQAAQTIYPSATDQSIAASRYLTGAQTIKGVAVANLTAANIKSGVTVTVGDSADADRIMSVTGTYSGGSSKNVQVAQSTSRATSSTYTKVASLTCSTAGKYDVYWDCYRSSTGGTSGSQLYIGGTASGSANTTFSNHAQNNHRTGVSIAANQEVAVYARSRGSNYYAYVGQLTIVQTA